MKYYLYLVLILIASPVFALKNGVERYENYKHLLRGKKLGFVVNQSSRIKHLHSIDYFRDQGQQITKLFALEHGLRGEAEAGEEIKNGKDLKTGLPVISLYGKRKAPSGDDLADVDLILFDVQDLGVRFYTYISSLKRILKVAIK